MIKRYHDDGVIMYEDDNGEYVNYDDYKNVINNYKKLVEFLSQFNRTHLDYELHEKIRINKQVIMEIEND